MPRPIIALLSPKGGCGKTTLAACIAAEMFRRGELVTLLDADPQGSLAEWHGGAESGRPLAQIPLIADPTERAARKAQDAAASAIVLVDTAGFKNRTQVDILAIADVVLIPCRPSPLDARRAQQAVDMATTVNADRRRKAKVAIVMNAAIRASIVGHIRNEMVSSGARVMGSEVGHRAVFAEAELYGSAPAWMGKSAAKAADEIAAVTAELLNLMRS